MENEHPSRIEKSKIGGLLYAVTTRKMVEQVKQYDPKIILCTGESITQEAELLKKKGFNVMHLTTDQGRKIYQRSTHTPHTSTQ